MLDGLLQGAGALEDVVHGASGANIQAKVEAQVPLRVQVNAQYPGAPLVQAADQRGGGGGFSHAALLIGDGYDLRQGISLPLSTCKNLWKSLKLTILQVDKK